MNTRKILSLRSRVDIIKAELSKTGSNQEIQIHAELKLYIQKRTTQKSSWWGKGFTIVTLGLLGEFSDVDGGFAIWRGSHPDPNELKSALSLSRFLTTADFLRVLTTFTAAGENRREWGERKKYSKVMIDSLTGLFPSVFSLRFPTVHRWNCYLKNRNTYWPQYDFRQLHAARKIYFVFVKTTKNIETFFFLS